MPRLSGRTSESDRVPTTWRTDVKSRAASRFASLPPASMNGASYSHRSPALMVSVGFNRQSSEI